MATDWQIGDLIQNRWEIHNILRGGMGIVYVVYDREHPNAYAAKTFQDEIFARDPAIAERFAQETLTWVNLDAHQNIAQAHFVEIIHGKPFLFLEYVSGGDLGDWIGTVRLTEDLPQVLRFAIQFCDGMTHALSKGIQAHRDIKPQNCLTTEDGTLKVTDFGLAKVFDDASLAGSESPGGESLSTGLTRTGMAAGTPTHMAPEQFVDAKRVDVRADIYSFGVMLYQMLTGRLPFVGRTWQEFRQLHKSQQPPALSTQHSTLRAVIEMCLAKDPAQRFADFRAVREGLAERYCVLTSETVPEPVRGRDLTAMEWTNKGASLNALGRSEEAIVCCDRALVINPRDEKAWTNKGNALSRLGRSEQAIACYDRALTINPRYAMVWTNKGAILDGLGRSEEAIVCHDRALVINPRDAGAWSNKGAALDSLGRSEEAIVCHDRALVINPRDAVVWTNKGTALSTLGRTEEAIECYGRALAINPRYAEAWYNTGAALVSLGRTGEAIEYYDRALAINPHLAEAWNNKGNALGRLGCSSEEAIVCYDRALEINPHYANPWNNKGVALVRLDRTAEAIRCYDRALAINPRYAEAWMNKGNALGRLGRSKEAIKYYDRALAINARYAEAWCNKGAALGNSGRIREALACFEEALRLGDPQAAQMIALCRQKLGK